MPIQARSRKGFEQLMTRPDLRFFCLRGFMKSGTNWLGSLLDRHRQVSCRGEYHWHEILGPILDKKANMSLLEDVDFRRFLIQQLRSVVRRTLSRNLPNEIVLAGDRTPHTIAPLILNAPHIVLIRDGRDVLVSRAFHLFNRPTVTAMFQRSKKMATSLTEFQKDKWYFKENPAALLAEPEFVIQTAKWWVAQQESDRRTLKHYPNLPVRFVQYETLLERTQEITDELFEFLGVDPALAAPIEGSLQPGFETEQPDQFLRKGEAGDWVNYFTDENKRTFKQFANEELIRQGYVANDQW